MKFQLTATWFSSRHLCITSREEKQGSSRGYASDLPEVYLWEGTDHIPHVRGLWSLCRSMHAEIGDTASPSDRVEAALKNRVGRKPLIGAVASPCALHWALVVETHTHEQRRAEKCVKLGITQHQVILRWYFCSLTLWSFHMLPSVESTHCTYGIFIHAVRWSWIISSYISSFPSIFRQERKNDFLYNILARVLK